MARYVCLTRRAKKDALVVGGEPDQDKSPGMTVDLLVDGAKILVMCLRQIGRVARQSKWIYGNGRSFANGRLN